MGTYEKIMRPWFDSWVGKIHQRRDRLPTPVFWGFPCGSAGKESTCNVGTWVRSLGWEDPLEKGKTTHSSILPWRIPWIICPWGCKELDQTEQLLLHFTGLRPDLQNPNI